MLRNALQGREDCMLPRFVRKFHMVFMLDPIYIIMYSWKGTEEHACTHKQIIIMNSFRRSGYLSLF